MRRRGTAGAPAAGATPPDARTKAAAPDRDAISAEDSLFGLLLGVHLLVRVVSALFMPIMDCDETYNFVEPTHFLAYGFGFQTWEYSPEFALRSYAYLLPHAGLVRLLGLVLPSKRVAFLAFRAALALACALCEWLFCGAISRAISPRMGRYTLFFLLFSPGMAHAASAFLPSTFAMCALMASLALHLRGRVVPGLLTASSAVLLGWPFAGALFLTQGVDALLRVGVRRVAVAAVAALALFAGAGTAVDSHFYGKPVFAAANIVLYNVFPGPGRGPELYGSEPASFYLVNLALNHPVGLPLAALSPLVLALRPATVAITRRRVVLVLLAPLALWLAVMWPRKHKEERFMSPVYPLIAFAAAASLATARIMVSRTAHALGMRLLRARHLGQALTLVVCAAALALGLSRAWALVHNYGAPLRVWSHVAALPQHQPALVCVGKEWHRFPSSFFLPSDNVQLGFLRSSFRGQLPAPFSTGPDATSVVHSHFNDLNREEPSRYVSLENCTHVVDLELPGDDPADHLSRDTGTWRVVAREPFLDASQSPALSRALFIPWWSPRRNTYADYVVVERR